MRLLTKQDLRKFIDFNIKVYPERMGIEKSLEFKFNCLSEIEKEHNYYTAIINDKDDEIFGQFQRIPCIYYYQGHKCQAFWGMDYIVDELHRGGPAGVMLAKKVLKEPHFGMGLSPISYKIHLLLGEKLIGEFYKFVYFRSLSGLIRLLLNQIFCKTNAKGIRKTKNPPRLSVDNREFVLVNDYSMFQTSCFKSDIIEFDRSQTFMQWRYGTYPSIFSTYVLRNGAEIDAYFVVRHVLWKNTPFVLLVDYRFKHNNIVSIIKAVKQYTRHNSVAGAITLSSLAEADRALIKALFFRFGKAGQIVSNVQHDINQDRIDKRNAVQVTFADSDADFFYGNNHWYEA